MVVITLCSGLPLLAQTSSITIEAESMTLSSYAVEDGNRIKLSAGTGSASTTFNGASGIYNLQVYVQPETDGQPTVEIYTGSTLLFKYTYPLSDAATSFVVSNVVLNAGDTISLVGTQDTQALAFARIDKIVLTPIGAGSAAASTPYSGTPVALPKAFEAVNFDNGGQGVAYNDLTAGNSGGQYRTAEDVDITTSADAQGGGYTVTNFQTGEWLAYTVNVPSAGSYDLAIRAANGQSAAASFHIEIDGASVTGPVPVRAPAARTPISGSASRA